MVDPTLSPSVLRVRQALAALNARGSVRVLDDSARTARDAAAALGVEVGQIASSLVFRTVPPVLDPDHGRHEREGAGEPLLVVTSGAHRVDTRKVADLLGVAGLDRATPETVRAATGFAIGGGAPVGPPPPLRPPGGGGPARDAGGWGGAGDPHAAFSPPPPRPGRVPAG